MGCWAIGGPFWDVETPHGWGEMDDNPEVIALCEKYNLAAINRGPLAMGLLTCKYSAATKVSDNDMRGVKSPDWMKYFKDGKPCPEWMAKRTAIQQILTSGGRTVAQGALAWLWARSPQTLPIPGFRTVKQVEENVGAMEFGPLTLEQMREIEIIAVSKVRPRRIKNAKIAFECTLHEIVTVGNGPSAGNLVLASVLAFHVDDTILRDGREISWADLDNLGRVGGSNRFCKIQPVIEM